MKSIPAIFEQPLAREILGYLLRYPDANDTVEGIAEWWLLEQQIRHSIAEVKAALNEFVAQDVVITRRGADGRMHYRVNPAEELEVRKRIHLRSAARATVKRRGSRDRAE